MNRSKPKTPSYILSFTWQEDNREIRDIIDQTFKLTLKNLKESIFLEIDSYYKSKKESIINRDLARVEYLSEQSLIAKELGIKEASGDYSMSELDKNGYVSFNVTPLFKDPYYLRGYQSINLEIDLMKNRRYVKLKDIKDRIDLLKKKDIKWIDYNIFLLDTKLRNASKTLSWSFVILFSLIIGVVYVFISNAFRPSKADREKLTN